MCGGSGGSGGGSGGGGKSGRGGGGGGAQDVDVSRSGGSMSGNPIDGGFRIGDDVEIKVEGTSYKDKRMHSALKDQGFEFNSRQKTWERVINKVESKDEVMTPINKLPNRASEVRIKVSSYNYNPGVDRFK